jgi:WD40 repeat protein
MTSGPPGEPTSTTTSVGSRRSIWERASIAQRSMRVRASSRTRKPAHLCSFSRAPEPEDLAGRTSTSARRGPMDRLALPHSCQSSAIRKPTGAPRFVSTAEIIFFSNRPGTLGGADLWVSSRKTVFESWSAPVNLGPVVNSTSNDSPSYLSSDGLVLFITSDRPGGFGSGDLYVSTRERINQRSR